MESFIFSPLIQFLFIYFLPVQDVSRTDEEESSYIIYNYFDVSQSDTDNNNNNNINGGASDINTTNSICLDGYLDNEDKKNNNKTNDSNSSSSDINYLNSIPVTDDNTAASNPPASKPPGKFLTISCDTSEDNYEDFQPKPTINNNDSTSNSSKDNNNVDNPSKHPLSLSTLSHESNSNNTDDSDEEWALHLSMDWNER